MMTREIEAVLRDPAASNWLKQQLLAATDRDALDALLDAEALARLLCDRYALILAQATQKALIPSIDLRAELESRAAHIAVRRILNGDAP